MFTMFDHICFTISFICSIFSGSLLGLVFLQNPKNYYFVVNCKTRRRSQLLDVLYLLNIFLAFEF